MVARCHRQRGFRGPRRPQSPSARGRHREPARGRSAPRQLLEPVTRRTIQPACSAGTRGAGRLPAPGRRFPPLGRRLSDLPPLYTLRHLLGPWPPCKKPRDGTGCKKPHFVWGNSRCAQPTIQSAVGRRGVQLGAGRPPQGAVACRRRPGGLGAGGGFLHGLPGVTRRGDTEEAESA